MIPPTDKIQQQENQDPCQINKTSQLVTNSMLIDLIT